MILALIYVDNNQVLVNENVHEMNFLEGSSEFIFYKSIFL